MALPENAPQLLSDTPELATVPFHAKDLPGNVIAPIAANVAPPPRPLAKDIAVGNHPPDVIAIACVHNMAIVAAITRVGVCRILSTKKEHFQGPFLRFFFSFRPHPVNSSQHWACTRIHRRQTERSSWVNLLVNSQ